MRPLTEHEADLVWENARLFDTQTLDQASAIRDRRLRRAAYSPDTARFDVGVWSPPADRKDRQKIYRQDAIWIVALMLLAAAGMWLFIGSAVASGPGCPGDPAWLGYCSEVTR